MCAFCVFACRSGKRALTASQYTPFESSLPLWATRPLPRYDTSPSTHFSHLLSSRSLCMLLLKSLKGQLAHRRLSFYQHDMSKCLRVINVPLMRIWLILSAHLMWWCRIRSPMVTLWHALPPLCYDTYWQLFVRS